MSTPDTSSQASAERIVSKMLDTIEAGSGDKNWRVIVDLLGPGQFLAMWRQLMSSPASGDDSERSLAA